MTVFIDPPRWPAHGTVFSHMISDHSVEQLQEFARGLGISSRAFDLDHYDVPAHRYEDAIDAGAVPVDGKALVRLLVRSGLRVPARRRHGKLAATLTQRWRRHFPGQDSVGAELIERWSEPHRRYHDLSHLLAVLESLDLLVDSRRHPCLVAAAWFHDAVYEGRPGTDEERSADLARSLLTEPHWTAHESHRVADLVLVTLDHRPDPGDPEAAALVDADLSVLGSTPTDYDRYAEAVRAEYSHVPDEQFVTGRRHVLTTLADAPYLFHTPRGRTLWEDTARQNLMRERAALDARLRA